MKPYTFANGVTIKKNQIIAAPIAAIHFDENIYENPGEFDGFRFSKMREQGIEKSKHYAVGTSTEFLIFGHGEHAW